MKFTTTIGLIVLLLQLFDATLKDSCSFKCLSQLSQSKNHMVTPFYAYDFLNPFIHKEYREVPTLKWLSNVNDMTSDDIQRLKMDIVKNGVVKIQNQKLSPKQQMIFSEKIGKVIEIPVSFRGKDYHPDYPNIVPVTNYWANGTWKGKLHSFGQYWHKDGNFFPFDQSYLLSMLYADEFDENIVGGGTAFIDACSLRKDIPSEIEKKINGTWFTMNVREIPDFKKATEEDLKAFTTVEHNVIFTHPDKKEECVFMTRQMKIKQSEKERKAALNRLWDFMQNPKYIYKQNWKTGDIIIWDNFGTFHRALPYVNNGLRRILYRTQIRLDTHRNS